MKNYYAYDVSGCDDNNRTRMLLALAFGYSDAFSLVYCHNIKNRKTSIKARYIRKKLEKFEINSREVTEWPGTKTLSNQNYIYTMVTYDISTIKNNMEAFTVLAKPYNLWQWAYPRYPMDPCFYQNGYAWLVITSHEHLMSLYVGDNQHYPSLLDLSSIGLDLRPKGNVPESMIYFNKYFE